MDESTYIDRCEFDRTMQERYCFNCERIKKTHYPIFGVACKTCWVMDMLDEVETFPAADVVEVVRCKDCRYYYKDSDGYEMCDNSEGYEHISADGFCAWAKRMSANE